MPDSVLAGVVAEHAYWRCQGSPCGVHGNDAGRHQHRLAIAGGNGVIWRMTDGDRVVSDSEWVLFTAGLAVLLDLIDDDLDTGDNDTCTGISSFENLTPEQKLAL